MHIHNENIKNIPGLVCLLLILSGGYAILDRGLFFMENQEVWKGIPGYEGYIASSKGIIKSTDRTILHRKYGTQTRVGVVLSQHINKHGYLQVIVKNKVLTVHRLMMMAFYGEMNLPVDHINGIKTDNRIENLEYVTTRENAHRYYIKKTKASGHIGVYYHKKAKKWMASIQINGVNKYLGLFKTEQEAHEKYQKELNNIV